MYICQYVSSAKYHINDQDIFNEVDSNHSIKNIFKYKILTNQSCNKTMIYLQNLPKNEMFMYIISTLLWHIYIYGYKCHFLFVWLITSRLIEQLYSNNTLGKDDNIFKSEAQQIR